MIPFDDERSDKTFVAVAAMVAGFRGMFPAVTNTEIAYALLQTCACIDDGYDWQQFLHEALDECISQEDAA